MKFIKSIGLALMLAFSVAAPAAATTVDDIRTMAENAREKYPDIKLVFMEGVPAQALVKNIIARLNANPLDYEFNKVVLLVSVEAGKTIVFILKDDEVLSRGMFPNSLIESIMREASDGA